MSNFPLPKGYQRMGSFPIDETTLFNTVVELEAYALNSGAAYTGQICSVVENETVYIIKADKTIATTASGGADYGIF
jgi:hypothetical protein